MVTCLREHLHANVGFTSPAGLNEKQLGLSHQCLQYNLIIFNLSYPSQVAYDLSDFNNFNTLSFFS
jgi:hypothetical protein